MKAIRIVGPTASGKSAFALALASRFPIVIVNADSQQVYQGMVIGTGSPSPADKRVCPHTLYNYYPPDTAPDTAYDLGIYLRDVEALLVTLASDRIPVFVGGAGFYQRALTQGLPDLPRDLDLRRELGASTADLYAELETKDPQAARRIHPHNRLRLIRALEVIRLTGKPFSAFRSQALPIAPLRDCHWLSIGVALDRETLYRRIDERVEAMIAQGWVDEVRSLMAKWGDCWVRTLGYKELLNFFQGNYSLDDCKTLIKKNTRHYAKRQLTWFRHDSTIIWGEERQLLAQCEHWLQSCH